MRIPRREEQRDKQTIVAGGRSDVVRVLPIDFLVSAPRANVSQGSTDRLRNAGRGESCDLANIRKSNVSLGVLVNWTQVAGLAAGSLSLRQMQWVLWFSSHRSRNVWLPLHLCAGDGGGSDEQGRGQENKEGRGEVHHLCEAGRGICWLLLAAFYRPSPLFAFFFHWEGYIRSAEGNSVEDRSLCVASPKRRDNLPYHWAPSLHCRLCK
jgi:hypothetical protein